MVVSVHTAAGSWPTRRSAPPSSAQTYLLLVTSKIPGSRLERAVASLLPAVAQRRLSDPVLLPQEVFRIRRLLSSA